MAKLKDCGRARVSAVECAIVGKNELIGQLIASILFDGVCDRQQEYPARCYKYYKYVHRALSCQSGNMNAGLVQQVSGNGAIGLPDVKYEITSRHFRRPSTSHPHSLPLVDRIKLAHIVRITF